MKTAKEVLSDLGISDVFAGERNLAICESIVKLYATEVAEQALSKAAQRLHISYISQELTPEEETKIILSTNIIAP